MNTILLTIAVIAFAEVFAWVDFMYIVTFRISPKHWSRAVIRFVVLLIFALVAGNYSIESVYYLAYGCSVFWLLFELRLNQKRDLSPFYIGKNAWSDKLFRAYKIDGEKLFIFKILLIFNCLVALYFNQSINNLILQTWQLLNN
jgi:hypothetical protein